MTTSLPLADDLVGQRSRRLEKVKALRALGINPYPSKVQKDHANSYVADNFEKLENQEVILAGRIISWREHGKLIFGHIQDQTGKMQLFIKEEALKKTNKETQIIGFADLQLLDIGDIIQAKGTVTKTQRGEVSLLVSEICILAKAIRPLPDQWNGLKNKEVLFRQRYLDTILNPAKKEKFEIAAKITFAIRDFLTQKGFLEIKTPILQPNYGGATAKPFKTVVNALDSDYYLSISHELYLKRLITAGFENVFNLVGYFRNEGIDRTHNPEFMMLETMSAYQNYEYNMNLMEELYRDIAQKVFGRTVFQINNHEIDFAKKWERISMLDAVKKYENIDFNEVKTLQEAQAILAKVGSKECPQNIGECMVEVFKTKVEEKLVQPTFIIGHPVEISPLAKAMDTDKRFVERFEIFIGGIEQGDNWTELNDPVELFERFKAQAVKKQGGDEEAHPMDIEFIEMMEYGMPPTTGLGPGIERMVMTFTNAEYIDDVIFFPMMRPSQITKMQKKIYGEENLGLTHSAKKEEVKKQDKSKKIVIVIDEKLESWRLANTVGHLAAYLGNKIDKSNFHSRSAFSTKDGTIPSNSQYPVIVFATTQAKLRKLLTEVEDTDLPFLAFTKDMVDFNDDEELNEHLSRMTKDEITYYGIGFFGEKEKIDSLTKKFSLFK